MLVESFSGIRGVFGSELTLDVCKRYACAYFDCFLQKRVDAKIVIGRDSRSSGEDIFDAIVSVLNCEIIDVGILSTPMIENAVRDFECDGGIIISGSHLDSEFNGLKLLGKDGAFLKTFEIDKVIKYSREVVVKMVESGRVRDLHDEALEKYIEFVKKIVGEINSGNVRIVLDPNGGAGVFARKVLESFGVDAFYVNMELGIFNRKIEPGVGGALQCLKEEIDKNGVDFAGGFDCDADRMEILLKDGRQLTGHHLIAIVVDYILSNLENPGSQVVVVNEDTSHIVKRIVEKYGAVFKEVEVGEINVVDEMIKNNSLIGGEGSGSGVIISPSRCRDGVLTLLYLLKIIGVRGKDLGELLDELPEHYFLKDKISFKGSLEVLKTCLKDYFLKKGFEIIEHEDKSRGIKVLKNGSWILFRTSKTESGVLRLSVDSSDKNVAEDLLKKAEDLCRLG